MLKKRVFLVLVVLGIALFSTGCVRQVVLAVNLPFRLPLEVAQEPEEPEEAVEAEPHLSRPVLAVSEEKPEDELLRPVILTLERLDIGNLPEHGKPTPSFLVVEYIPIVGRVRAEPWMLHDVEWTKNGFVVDGGVYWEVQVSFSAPNKPQKTTIDARVISSSGEILKEGNLINMWEWEEASKKKGRYCWAEVYSISRQAAKLELIEKVQ